MVIQVCTIFTLAETKCIAVFALSIFTCSCLTLQVVNIEIHSSAVSVKGVIERAYIPAFTVYALIFVELNFLGSRILQFSWITDLRNFCICFFLTASATQEGTTMPKFENQKQMNGQVADQHTNGGELSRSAHTWPYKCSFSSVRILLVWHQWRFNICTGISSCMSTVLIVKVIVWTSPFLQFLKSNLQTPG